MNEILLQYLIQASKDDKDAFTKFAENISKRIFSIAYKITNDKMHSEDVLNIVLLKTWENIDKIIKLKNPIGYINTIAYNAALDIVRKAREFPLFDNMSAPEQNIVDKTDIETALKHLTSTEREIVLYHTHANLSFRKIAMLMNSTKKAVYLKYKKAVGKLKEFLAD